MKKRIAAFLLGLAVTAVCAGIPGYVADAAGADIVIADAFPDYDLQDYVSKNFDKDQDGSLNEEEIAGATELNLGWSWVMDLTGIEHLTALKKLDINCTWVSEVDVTNNTELEVLNLMGCYDIAMLDVSNNPKLTYLDITQTIISSLNLTNNKELVTFIAEEAPIESVDFSNNSKLEEVNLTNTKVSSVKLDNLTELKKINLDMSAVASVDVSKNLKLEELTLVGNAGITSLDVTANTALKVLDISGTGISEISLTANTALEEFYNYAKTVYKHDHETGWGDNVDVAPAALKSLDLINNTNLKKLYVDGTKVPEFETLDLTKMDSLSKISVENAGVQSIKFNDQVTYEAIYTDGNNLLVLDLPKNVSSELKADLGNQTRTVKVASSDTLETFDLNSIIDITKVSVNASEDVEYNSETGIITFKGDKKVFTYVYKADDAGTKVMNVTVTVEKKTVEEEAAEKAEADKATAQPVIDMISGIGTVTLESENAIVEARAAYDALTEDQKQYVENYNVLTEAENALTELKKESEVVPDAEDEKETDKTTDKESDKQSTVKTADEAPVMLYLVIMAAAVISFVLAAKRRISR